MDVGGGEEITYSVRPPSAAMEIRRKKWIVDSLRTSCFGVATGGPSTPPSKLLAVSPFSWGEGSLGRSGYHHSLSEIHGSNRAIQGFYPNGIRFEEQRKLPADRLGPTLAN